MGLRVRFVVAMSVPVSVGYERESDALVIGGRIVAVGFRTDAISLQLSIGSASALT